MESVFETERLVARELLRSDFKFFHAMQSDDLVMLYTTGSGFCAEENRRQLEDCIDRYSKPDNNFWVFAVVEKSTNQFVGTCAIVPNEGVPEIGYRLLR